MHGGVGGTGGGRITPARRPGAAGRFGRGRVAAAVFVVAVGVASAFGAHSALTDWNAKPCKSLVTAPASAPLVFSDPADWKNVPADSPSAVEWNDPANWTPAGVPTANDRVCVDFDGVQRAITVSGPAVRVGSLELAAGVVLDLRPGAYLSSARTVLVSRRATVLLSPSTTLAADDRVRLLAGGRIAATAPPVANDASTTKPRRARAADVQLATIAADVDTGGYLATKSGAGLRVQGSMTLLAGSTIDNAGELFVVPSAITAPTVIADGGTTQGNEVEVESGTLLLRDAAPVHIRMRGNATVGGTMPGRDGLTIEEGTSVRFVERLRTAAGSSVRFLSPGGSIRNRGSIAFEACGPISVTEVGANDRAVNQLINDAAIDVYGPGARSACPDSRVVFTNGASLDNRSGAHLALSGPKARLHITGPDTTFTAGAGVDLSDRDLGDDAFTVDGDATFVSKGGIGRPKGKSMLVGPANVILRDGGASGTPGAKLRTVGPITLRGVLGDLAELTATDDVTLSGDLTVNGSLTFDAGDSQPLTVNLGRHAINRDAATSDPTIDLLPPRSRSATVSFSGSNCVIEGDAGLIGIPQGTTFENDCDHLSSDEMSALDVTVLGRVVNGAGKSAVFGGPKMRLLARAGEIINNGTLRLHKDATFLSGGSSTQGNPVDLVGSTTLIFPAGTRGASHLRVSGDGTGTRSHLEGTIPSAASIELNTANGYESRLVPAVGAANRGRITMVCGPGAATAFIDAAVPFVNTGTIEVGVATKWPGSPLPSCVATTIDTSTKGRLAVRAGNALTIRSLTLSAKNSSTGGSLVVDHGIEEGPQASVTVTGTLALLRGSVTNNGAITVDRGRLDLNTAEADLGNAPIVLRRGTLRSTGHGFAHVRTVGDVRWEASPSAPNAEERLIPAGSILDVRGSLSANGPIVNNGTVILGTRKVFDTSTPSAPNGNVFTNHGEVLLRGGGPRTIKVSSFVNTHDGDASGFVRNDSDDATITGVLHNGADGAKDATVLLSSGSRLRAGSLTNDGRVWVQIGDRGPGTMDVSTDSRAGGELKVSMNEDAKVGTSFTVIKGPLVGPDFDRYDLGEDSFKPESVAPDSTDATAGDTAPSLRITYKGSAVTRTAIGVSPQDPRLGDDVTITAIVDGANGRVPAGTEITFRDGRQVLGTAPATVDGRSVSATFTVKQPAIGPHVYRADYPGTTGHLPSNNYLSVTVGTGPSTVAVEQGRVAPIGQPYELAATVSSGIDTLTPTGTVTFVDETMVVPTVLGTAALKDGRASIRWTPTTDDFGKRIIRALYEGDTNLDPSRSKKHAVEVQRATTTSLASSSVHIPFGEVLTLTATIDGVPPGTPVTFVDGSAIIGTAKIRRGIAELTITDAPAGKHTYKAVYPGETGFAPSEGTAIVSVDAIDGFVSLDAPSTVTIDDDVLLVARVQPESATGTITFLDTTAATERTIGTATITDGMAKYTWRPGATGVGNRSIVGRYDGSPNIKAARSSTAYMTLQRATEAALEVTPSTATYGDLVTLTLTIAGSVPDGTLATFRVDDGTPARVVPIVRGRAAIELADLIAGSHRISAEFTGTVGYLPSTAATLIRVAPRSTAVRLTSPTTVDAERTGTLTAEITPKAATGTVTFVDTAAAPDRVLGSASVTNGVARLVWSPAVSAVGARSIVARYEGTANDAPSVSASASVLVERSTATDVMVFPGAPVVGEPLAITARVTGGAPPGATVTFTDGDRQLGTAVLKAGKATLYGVLASGGTHTFQASYPGATGFRPSIGTGFTTVAPAAATVTLAGPTAPTSYGAPARFTVTVRAAGPTPTNVVRLRRNGVIIGPAAGRPLDGSGSATFEITDLPAGTSLLTADYVGDADHRTDTSDPLTVSVAPAIPTITARVQGLPRLGQPIRLAIDVTAGPAPRPDGLISVSDSSGPVGSATLTDGRATVVIKPSTAVGMRVVTLAYGGNKNVSPARTPLPILVAKAKPAVSLTATLPQGAADGTSVVFRAEVRPGAGATPTPTGSVVFYDGPIKLATRQVTASRRTAQVTAIIRLTVGPHPHLRAEYLGDDAYDSRTSADVWATVLDPSSLLPGPAATEPRTTPLPADGRKTVIPLAVAPATKSRRA